MRALVLLGVLALGMVVGGGWVEYRCFVSRPLDLGAEKKVLEVERGGTLRSVSDDLVVVGALDQPYLFMLMAHVNGQATRIKAGEYAIPDGITPEALLSLLASGKVMQHAITLVEGWTFQQAREALADDDRLEKVLGPDLTGEEVMARLGHPDQHPEGRFFPDTYHFPKGASDLDVLQRAYATMQRALAEEWEKRDDGLPLETPYEALILASIVEKETGLAEERSRIAGVFIRRLQQEMKLQTDPTVIYGLGARFDGDITRADLREDTAYNTYVHQGLPPTPIALPGRGAIQAVLQPEAGDSLYFVSKGDGSHHFSATLAEHNRAVRLYQLGNSR